MERIEQFMGPTLFRIWLFVVLSGTGSWAFDLMLTAIRHQFTFCR